MQNLLVSGRKKEALQYAQEGQLWGPALVLASQLGEQVCCQFHSDYCFSHLPICVKLLFFIY